ncbi:protein of unknown function [Candidatus Nitrosocosmicus franklandus]|uniref:Uncharacterized protein n=1 Tax=Candidatus Nitrosocosmicus franklandianus TaxID=1798806 RepID=A0A484ICW6_9ARCH|nr:protein of unknown function [Candidatus Nitrosocosmicus franklandus]
MDLAYIKFDSISEDLSKTRYHSNDQMDVLLDVLFLVLGL